MATPSTSAEITASRRSARATTTAQAVATGAAGAGAFIAGSGIAVATTYGPFALMMFATIASLALLLWLLGVAALGLAMRRARAMPFAIAAVAIAPVACFAEALVSYGGAQLLSYPYMIVLVVWRSLGLVGAALVGAIVGVLVRRRREAAAALAAMDAGTRASGDSPAEAGPAGTPASVGAGAPSAEEALRVLGMSAGADAAVAGPAPSGTLVAQSATDRDPRRSGILSFVCVALLVGGAALAFVLPTQWLVVYFRIGGDPAVATPEQGARYLWTAGSALALLVAALAIAIVRRGGGLIVLTSIALACALIGAFVFQVPQGRFWPDPTSVPFNDDSPVCYGTTGDCPGG